MIAFVYYPIYLITFWYRNVIGGIFSFFIQFNRYAASLLSLPLLLRTFFKPLKNEYRDGLVLFSILFGMVLKTVLISVSLLIISLLLLIELFIGVILIVFPIAMLYLGIVRGNLP